jgi:hypothetical protein
MTLESHLNGLRLKLVEFGVDDCTIGFDNGTGMTIYSDMVVNMIASGEKPLFLELNVTDECLELRFTNKSSISISRTPKRGPEIFVYRATDGHYIVE